MLNNLMAKCEIKGGLNLLSSNVNIELGFFYVRELRGYLPEHCAPDVSK